MPIALLVAGAAGVAVGFGGAFTVSDAVRSTARLAVIGAGGYLAYRYLKKGA